MKTLKNQTGTKAVNISKTSAGFICMYVQVYNGEEQVLESKSYTRENACIKWANGKLS